jgi:hypothetical protein
LKVKASKTGAKSWHKYLSRFRQVLPTIAPPGRKFLKFLLASLFTVALRCSAGDAIWYDVSTEQSGFVCSPVPKAKAKTGADYGTAEQARTKALQYAKSCGYDHPIVVYSSDFTGWVYFYVLFYSGKEFTFWGHGATEAEAKANSRGTGLTGWDHYWSNSYYTYGSDSAPSGAETPKPRPETPKAPNLAENKPQGTSLEDELGTKNKTSLSDTVNELRKLLNRQPTIQQFVRGNSIGYQYSVAFLDLEGHVMRFREEYKPPEGGSPFSVTTSVPLEKIDPETIAVLPRRNEQHWKLVFKSKDSQREIGQFSEGSPFDSDNQPLGDDSIGFGEKDSATRAARLLKHAVELCSGN